jgi:hypothetical protein
MNEQNEIIEIARQAGLPAKHPDWIKAYLAFEKLVAAKEREACALIADSMDALQDGAIGKAIRARAQADGGEA